MKTANFASILIFFSFLFFTGCTPENFNYPGTAKEIISQGTWSVDYFYAGQDKTAQFSSYHFTFTGNGTLTGANATNNFSGTWSMVRDVNRNDVIRISISSQEPYLTELNESWNVTSKDINVIAMQDGNNAQLRFKKL